MTPYPSRRALAHGTRHCGAADSLATWVLVAVATTAIAVAPTATAFADGVMPINERAPCERCAPARLTWRSPSPCARDVGSPLPGAKTVAIDLAIQVTLPEATDQAETDVITARPCVAVTARSSDSPVWWFQMPPAAAHDRTVVVCPDGDGKDVAMDASTGATRSNNVYTVTGTVHVPAGFTRLAAQLHESETLAPEAVAVVSVGDHGLTDRQLQKAFDSARAMERDENEPARGMYEAHAQQ